MRFEKGDIVRISKDCLCYGLPFKFHPNDIDGCVKWIGEGRVCVPIDQEPVRLNL